MRHDDIGMGQEQGGWRTNEIGHDQQVTVSPPYLDPSVPESESL